MLRDDTKFASSKIGVFQYVTVGVFLFLISGFWQLQIQNEETYSEAAARNRIKSLPILAPRGKILDRDGRMIVDNHSSFSLILSRENLRPEHIKPIAEGLNLDPEDLEAKLKRFRNRPKYEPIIIKDNLHAGRPGLRQRAPRLGNLPGDGVDRGAAAALSQGWPGGAGHRLRR